MPNPVVWFEIEVRNEHRPFSPEEPDIVKVLPRFYLELFADKVPKAAENMRCLCTGEKGKGTDGRPLHYKGSFIHRIVKDFCVHMGDIGEDGWGTTG